MATAALRTACKRLGGRALRPALAPAAAAAAGAAQPSLLVQSKALTTRSYSSYVSPVIVQTPSRLLQSKALTTRSYSSYVSPAIVQTPSRLLQSKGMTRSYSSNLPAVIAQDPNTSRKVHLEVSGRLLPMLGFTDMSVYKVTVCSDNAEFAGNMVRKFVQVLQSDRADVLRAYLSHDVTMVEVKRVVGKGVMEITLQSLQHAAELRFELESLKDMVMAEGVSARNEVKDVVVAGGDSIRNEVKAVVVAEGDSIRNELKVVQQQIKDNDFLKAVMQGCAVNCLFMLLLAAWAKMDFAKASEDEMDIPNVTSA